VSNDTCHVSLDMAYKYVANEVIKICTSKNSTIIMAMNKQFLTDYLFNYSSND
jgi:hypothetical protein